MDDGCRVARLSSYPDHTLRFQLSINRSERIVPLDKISDGRWNGHSDRSTKVLVF
jgi:hypothetical protein